MSKSINPEADLIIGSRGSPLALAQAHEVKQRLENAHENLASDSRIKIETISTKGDRIRDKPLATLGGKELFTKEIEDALLAGDIHIAQHSLKDLPTEQPPGLVVAAILPRENPFDALIWPGEGGFDALPKGARLGTSSLRRSAFLRARRPDLELVDLRGNVETRLAKIERGEADATILAVAGLNRLGMADRAQTVLPTDILLPAPGQGAVALECRADDTRTLELLAPLNCTETQTRIDAERALLAALDGSCRTPIAALAEIADGQLHLRAAIARPDGSEVLSTSGQADPNQAAALGDQLGQGLRGRAGSGFFG